ncbi:hypothetical protein HRbin21_00348 [bacterium HR21]|nr:hypothetical protein HRbin21_00348 [bacterium HR21]
MLASRWHLVALLGIGLCAPTVVPAQQTPSSSPPEARWNRWIERLSKQLDLTTQQQEQLRTLLRQRWEEQQRLRERFRQQLKELLTPQQWEKLQELRREHREKLRERVRQRRLEKRSPHSEGPPYQ